MLSEEQIRLDLELFEKLFPEGGLKIVAMDAIQYVLEEKSCYARSVQALRNQLEGDPNACEKASREMLSEVIQIMKREL